MTSTKATNKFVQIIDDMAKYFLIFVVFFFFLSLLVRQAKEKQNYNQICFNLKLNKMVDIQPIRCSWFEYHIIMIRLERDIISIQETKPKKKNLTKKKTKFNFIFNTLQIRVSWLVHSGNRSRYIKYNACDQSLWWMKEEVTDNNWRF